MNDKRADAYTPSERRMINALMDQWKACKLGDQHNEWRGWPGLWSFAVAALPVFDYSKDTRVEVLQGVVEEMYIVAGALGADAPVLDQLLAAVEGEPLPHKSLLPYEPPHPMLTAKEWALIVLSLKRLTAEALKLAESSTKLGVPDLLVHRFTQDAVDARTLYEKLGGV